MANKKKVEYLDVRIIKTKGGKLKFDHRCNGHRLAVRDRDYMEWVDLSKRDRAMLAEVLALGMAAYRNGARVANRNGK